VLSALRTPPETAPAPPDSYRWPERPIGSTTGWQLDVDRDVWTLPMPEHVDTLARDSRWPAFFPSAICHVTTRDGSRTALERLVGASIVNRFPYVLALTICRQHLSARHHPRATVSAMLESSGTAAVQFLPPGEAMARAMAAVQSVPDATAWARIPSTGLRTVPALTHDAPIFTDAYLVYEGRLVSPGRDVEGEPIFTRPWIDVGSHRVYFLEITAIQLRESIAGGREQIRWRSLPAWRGARPSTGASAAAAAPARPPRYAKGYTADYRFPSASTIAFERDTLVRGMAVKFMDRSATEADNDRARWPCFFPSSVGMITTWRGDVPNVMPCGSTMVISRHPLTIAPCVSYARINDRYAPRATFDLVRRTGRFGCGVPYLDAAIVDAIKIAGNTSLAADADKVARSGLTVDANAGAPIVRELPIHFDCAVVGEVRLGTHMMFLGEVRRIHVRSGVTPETPLEWCPFPQVGDADVR
jgi:flavin reductase (DIM6/NTAB) family NADH-FMN oxidoreductase RutF